MIRPRSGTSLRVIAIALAMSITAAAQDRIDERGFAAHDISPGQSHTYSIALRAGDFLRVDARQDDGDVVLTLTAPDGHDVIAVNASNDDVFPETLVAIAEQTGRFVIVVRPASEVRVTGRYSIRIASPRPATSEDREIVTAERSFADGMRLMDRAHAATWPQALERFRASLDTYRRAGDREGELKASFGVVWAEFRVKSGDVVPTGRETERLSRELNEPRVTAETLDLIGDALLYQGELTAALPPFEEALAMTRHLGDERGELRVLNDAALAYERNGQAERSIDMLKRAQELARRRHDSALEGNVLINLGVTYRQLGDYDQALQWYERALAFQRSSGDLPGQMLALNNVGNLKAASGKPLEALDDHRHALALARQIGSREQEARTLDSLGDNELLLGRAQQALDDERSALALREEIGDVPGQATSLDRIGLTLQHLGRLDEAAAAMEQSLAMRRNGREAYNQAESLFHLAGVERERHRADKALDYARMAVDLDEQLRHQIGNPDLRLTFRAGAEAFYELLIDLLQQRGSVNAAFDASERARARVLLESVAESRVDRSHFDALPKAEPLTARDIQQRVVDDGTVLLEFALGDERSWLWAVTPSEITSVELPSRRQIDAAARHAYTSLSSRSPVAAASTTALSRMLLAGVASRLQSDWRGKRLVIVPAGSLGYVPFAALPVPYGSGALRLADRHEIVLIPSASVVAALRDEATRRPPPRHEIAVVADPVFDLTDPRLNHPPARVVSTADRAPALPRLAFSRVEADAIASLAPPRSVVKVTDFQASRAAVLGGALDGYRVVHFATHGIVDNDRPAMSSLVLSLVDKGGARQDGYLRQRDIYGLHLDADLVVLSACQTALGKEVRGEGLVGLTRAFMYAGTPRVVASLWEVGDRATAEFMRTFYQHLLQGHMTPAAALRAAQLAMARNPRWSAPYYWAGFVLHGDWH